MSRKVIIAGNWKMNKTIAEAVALVRELKELVKDVDNVEMVVCPTATALKSVVDELAGSNVSVGAQNVHWEANGAFTGELSVEMLKEIGVTYVILGHSERRQYFGETDETVNKRLKAALAGGLTPLVCIGESLEERESNITNSVLEGQLKKGLAGLSVEDMANVVVAYEPIWAIGTGKTATADMAEETHAHVRSVLCDMFGEECADGVRIQYGGSMKGENSKELVSQEDIDGGLIGGASLAAGSFAELIKNAVG